jgi:hypothetical protein
MTFFNPYLNEYRASLSLPTSPYVSRQNLVNQYAWAVPTEEAIRKIASHGPLLEIGAGTGYWANLLRQVGADVLAYDRNPRDSSWGSLPVEIGGPEKAGEHPDRTLFLCWPPYDDPFADNCLAAYEEAGGHTFIYVGEPQGGCTGDDAFHERLFSSWDELPQRHVAIPQWPGIHDSLRAYRRAPEERLFPPLPL